MCQYFLPIFSYPPEDRDAISRDPIKSCPVRALPFRFLPPGFQELPDETLRRETALNRFSTLPASCSAIPNKYLNSFVL